MKFDIEIKGRVNHKWDDWFGQMEVTFCKDTTVLSGTLPDQSALHGLLNKILDLNLTLLSVNTDTKNNIKTNQ